MTLASVTMFDRCAVCQTINLHRSLKSDQSNNIDLDGRSIGKNRRTMHLWVHRCWHCGYCNRKLSELLPLAQETVFTSEYQALRESTHHSNLINKFLCQALILEKAGCIYDAGIKYLDAAWVCDDEKQSDLARRYRNQSIERMRQSRKIDYRDSLAQLPNVQFNDVILADTLRRTSRFVEAKKIIQEGFQKASSKDVLNILEQEMSLISTRNTAAQPAKASMHQGLVAIHGDFTLDRPTSDLPVELSGWQGFLGATLLMSVVMPLSMTFYVASFYFIDQGPALLGVTIGIVGFLVVWPVALRLGRWLERWLGISFNHT